MYPGLFQGSYGYLLSTHEASSTGNRLHLIELLAIGGLQSGAMLCIQIPNIHIKHDKIAFCK